VSCFRTGWCDWTGSKGPRVCFGLFWATLDVDLLMCSVVLRVREDPLTFAKKDLAFGILFFAFARRKSLLNRSDFGGLYLAIYKEFGDDPKTKVVALCVSVLTK